MSIGDKFHELIKKEIKVYAEPVMSSQNFLNSRKEGAKEIIRYENLHLKDRYSNIQQGGVCIIAKMSRKQNLMQNFSI